jgi:hypothetical protein
MPLQTLTTVDIFYVVTCKNPHEPTFIEIAFGVRARFHGTTLYT